MLRRLAKAIGLLAYAGVLFAVFAASSYVAFSLFVTSGVTSAPDIVGQALEEARITLSDQGFDLQVATASHYDANVPAGHVLEQQPAGGSFVKRGAQISVTLSQGPLQMTVPDLVGQSTPAAQMALTGASLALGRTLRVLGAGVEPGLVLEQAPRPGASIPPGSPVDILVATNASVDGYVMPDLVYRDYQRVRDYFEGRGFTVGSPQSENYEGIRPGTILRQSPTAGHRLRRSETISLVISAGPEGGF
ncbi:MAG: PASTA domain-containing protein [Thermoanaerobaculia bacterium]|nr:PASTA domain-containing protein [Thermoanaerobaculia bacterium]